MKFKLAICLLTLSFFSSLATATQALYNFDKPYVGIEAIQNFQSFKTGFGNKLFAKHPQSYNAFVGFKFSEYFGAEFGYEVQVRKNMDAVLFAGDQLPGQAPLTGTEFSCLQSYYKSTHPYLGVFTEYASNFTIGAGKAKLQALIGVSASKIEANNTLTASDAGLIIPHLVNTYAKRKSVLMIKLTAVGDISHNLGLRISLNYRNMKKFNVNSEQHRATPYIIKLKDAFGIGLGLKYFFDVGQ